MKERPPELGALLRSVIETSVRLFPHICVIGTLQSLVVVALLYGALHITFHYVSAAAADYAANGDIVSTGDMSGILENLGNLFLLLLAVWVALTVLRAVFKLLAAVFVESGPGGCLRTSGDAVQRFFTVAPLFVVLFLFTRPLTFVGYFVAGLPGLLMLSVFSLLAPLTVYGGWSFRRILAPLDRVDSERGVKLFAVYVLAGTIYLALPAAVLFVCYLGGLFGGVEAAVEQLSPATEPESLYEAAYSTPALILVCSTVIAFSLGDLVSTVAVSATMLAYRRADEAGGVAAADRTLTTDEANLTEQPRERGPYD